MEQKLWLGVFMLLTYLRVSPAAWQRVTAIKGQAVHLSCPITNAHQTAVEWKNPGGFIMFFRRDKALNDKRYSIDKLSESEFAISISNVTFRDGGTYTCYNYGPRTTETKVELTVVGIPKMKVTKHEGNIAIKCTAEGNHHPPQIYWKFDHAPEILARAQVQQEDNRYVSMDIQHVHSPEGRITVKCIVRHPALHSQALMNFVKIGRHGTKSRSTAMTTRSPAARPQGSKEALGTTASWSRRGRPAVSLPTAGGNGSASRNSARLPTVPSVAAPVGFSRHPVTSTGSRLNIGDDSSTSLSSTSTRTRNDAISNATSSTGWISVSETTVEVTSYNRTEGNRTGSLDDTKIQARTEGHSSLLVFLVTCLIICLLVVVIFFAIKLRRAHVLWKRENEESDPSEESSKSKSSQEVKNSQGPRRRGFFNTTFTQYVVNEPTVVTSVANTAAMAATESANEQPPSQSQTLGETSAKCNIKETEL